MLYYLQSLSDRLDVKRPDSSVGKAIALYATGPGFEPRSCCISFLPESDRR